MNCHTCGSKLRRKPAETSGNFKVRRHCDRICQYKNPTRVVNRSLRPTGVQVARKLILAGQSYSKIAALLGVGVGVIEKLSMSKTYQHVPWEDEA